MIECASIAVVEMSPGNPTVTLRVPCPDEGTAWITVNLPQPGQDPNFTTFRFPVCERHMNAVTGWH